MSTEQARQINLIADIGGTNIRLAIADITSNDSFRDLATYQCKDFSSLAEVILLYLNEKELITTQVSDKLSLEKQAINKASHYQINACFAIACPVDNDLISMTNLPWKFSQRELKTQLNLSSLTFINDYTAIALSIPLLSEQQKVKIGAGEAVAHKPISVCGPGTGLGVANLVPITHAGKSQWHCVGGEGGHIDFAPVDELEQQVLHYLNQIKDRVSYEQLLSGYGLEQIYQALSVMKDSKGGLTLNNKLSAKDISTKAITNQCDICRQALTLFCNVLGSFAGNLALIMNSQGGVYIAGGIVPRFIDYLKASDFRKRFEAKGRLSHITEQAPTYVITEPQPGLLGAAAFLLQ